MTNALATTVSRRGVLGRLLVAAAAAPVMGVRLADTVDASKKGQKKALSIKQKVDNIKEMCDFEKGTTTVTKRPGGTSVSCTGGEGGDWTCTAHSKGTRCHPNLTTSPAPTAGGGGAVPPSGGAETPTGGAKPGGGAHVPPGGGVDPDGGGSGPVLE